MMLTPLAVPQFDFSLGGLLDKRRRAACMKEETLAAAMGISRNQLSRQLSDLDHLSFQRLLLACADADARGVVIGFLFDSLRAIGINPELLAAIEWSRDLFDQAYERVLRVKLRMAKADLASDRQEGTG